MHAKPATTLPWNAELAHSPPRQAVLTVGISGAQNMKRAAIMYATFVARKIHFSRTVSVWATAVMGGAPAERASESTTTFFSNGGSPASVSRAHAYIHVYAGRVRRRLGDTPESRRLCVCEVLGVLQCRASLLHKQHKQLGAVLVGVLQCRAR